MRSFISYILLLFLIYPVGIVGIPLILRTWIGLFAGLYLLYKRYIPKRNLTILCGLIPFALLSICSSIINKQFDLQFISLSISYFIIYLSCYFFILYIKQDSKITIDDVLQKIVNIILLHSLLSLLIYIFPILGEYRNSIISISESEMSRIDETSGMRLHGFCSSFFYAGVINGLGLIIITYLYLKNKYKKSFNIAFIYLLILFIGILLARTTLLGFAVSLLFLFSWKWKDPQLFKNKIKLLINIILLLIICISCLINYLDENVINWAFEMFINLYENGEFSSSSTNHLQTMYIFPDSYKTWIYGDGLFSVSTGYYMDTDVGFIRLLYYGGIPIIFAFFYFHYYIIKKTFKYINQPLVIRLLYMIFFYLLSINLKGIQDFIIILFLIYFTVSIKQKEI